MLDLIEILFERHGIAHLRFDEKMDRAGRDDVLASFKRVGGPQAILVRFGHVFLHGKPVLLFCLGHQHDVR